MKYLKNTLLLLILSFNLLNGQLIKICDGICLPDQTVKICDGICLPDLTIKICDGICLPDKKLFITTNQAYDYIVKQQKIEIPIVKICDGICLPDLTIKICDGICLPDLTIQIVDNPNIADIIVFMNEDIIHNFSDFPMYKTVLKNYLSQTTLSRNSKSSFENEKKGFITKIDEDDDDILKLENGAIVEVSYGYLGYIGYRKDCIVYKSKSGWKIWIKGKKSFSCTILKEPSYTSKIDIQEVTISKVSSSGDMIFLTDGSIYEVSYQSYETNLWLSYSSALLINGFQIINLDEGSEIIDVVKIK